MCLIRNLTMPKTAVLVHDCGNPLATTDLFRVGMALYETLREKYLVEPSLRTNPAKGRECNPSSSCFAPPHLPRLFRAYLDISARVCGPPAIDRAFKTIDFLMLVDCGSCPIACARAFSNPTIVQHEKALASLTRRHSAGRERNRESRRPCLQVPPIPV